MVSRTSTYRVEYSPPGQRTVRKTYQAATPLTPGCWIVVDGGVYLVVERIVRGKPGDPYAGVALCKIAAG